MIVTCVPGMKAVRGPQHESSWWRAACCYRPPVGASWRLLDAEAAERRAFPDAATTLALPGVAAGPKNRLRSVREITMAGLGTYYLKSFQATQFKNRLRFRL